MMADEKQSGTTNESIMPNIRSLSAAFSEIKRMDPETAITKTAIARLIDEGKIRCIPIGRKKLVNVNEIISYFNTR